MQFEAGDVDIGIEAGLKRFEAEFPGYLTSDVRDYVRSDFSTLFLDVLVRWPNDCHPRFVKLVSEMLSLASAVRVYKNEGNLSSDDLFCSMGVLTWLFNSFKHH